MIINYYVIRKTYHQKKNSQSLKSNNHNLIKKMIQIFLITPMNYKKEKLFVYL